MDAPAGFTRAHRGGAGPPLVLLHGFTDTWRTWELVLPALERTRDVFAPTLAGHAGGPPLPHSGAEVGEAVLLDAIEAAMDEAGIATADIAGNSLGGYLALRLAARGRARSVVALAPAGGWTVGDPAATDTIRQFVLIDSLLPAAAARAEEIAASPEGRRRAMELTCAHPERLSAELVAHEIRGAAACVATRPVAAYVRRHGWTLDPARVTCPVRIVWGTADRLLRWPQAAIRYREWLPEADWVVLDDVGHCIQLDVPAKAAELIDGFAAGLDAR
jgi:pimeloyl-ACP methyl ester carboxylesterase